jgi:NAD(P)-dependent dehydrogenase (short-subunit alcohol dehydrogenase family)
MGSNGRSFDRYAEPSEIADVVAFIISECARFINGQILRIDGGFSLFSG